MPIIGVAVGVGLSALTSISATSGTPMAQRAAQVLDDIGSSIYGYSAIQGRFEPQQLSKFWAPVAGSTIAHKGLSWLGVNKILAKAKLGFTL